ncbi:hypothetical protein ACLGI4_01305 [Streptomyces sp. HMX112]
MRRLHIAVAKARLERRAFDASVRRTDGALGPCAVRGTGRHR